MGFRTGYGIGHLHDYGTCHHFSGAARGLRARGESQPFAVCVCHVRQEQGRERRRFIQRPHVGAYGARVL